MTAHVILPDKKSIPEERKAEDIFSEELPFKKNYHGNFLDEGQKSTAGFKSYCKNKALKLVKIIYPGKNIREG